MRGAVDPDEYQVFKRLLSDASLRPIIGNTCGEKAQKLIYADGDRPTSNVPTSKDESRAFVLSDTEILNLVKWATPRPITAARHGETGEMFIVQARPETV